MNGPLPQGGVRYSATLVADPLAKQSLALSPFQGACVTPLRQFIQGRAVGWATASKIWGVRLGYGSLFGDSSEEPPSPFYEWPSPPFRGRADGLREFIRRFEGRTPLAILRMALSPNGGVRLVRYVGS